MQRARLFRSLPWLLLGCCPIAEAHAQAADTDVCIQAHESAQGLEHSGRLRAARQDYIRCAQTGCPALLRRDCSDSVQRLTSSIPTVVVRARDGDGADLFGVSLFVDGELVPKGVDGRAFELDPGRHVFRCVDARGHAVEKPFAVLEGAKNQLVEVRVGKPTHQDTSPRRPPPYLAYGLGGFGIAAVGSFVYFGLAGSAKERSLNECAPLCDAADYRAMRRDYIVADISLGAGVLLLAASTYLLVTHDGNPGPARRKATSSRRNPRAPSPWVVPF